MLTSKLDSLSRRQMILIIIAVYLITHLAILTYVPFIADEGPYSVMIEEQAEHPSTVLTFLGYAVPWKPPVMFWTYSVFAGPLRGLPIPIEAVYRLPSTFFGLANALLVFLIFERLLKDRKEAFLISMVYLTTFLPIYVDSAVLTDTMCGTAIFAGVLAYVHGLSDRRMFIAGGLLTFIAYFIKQANAATIPVVAVALLFEKDKKKLADPLFLVSLAAFPIAIYLFNANLGALIGSDVSYLAQKSILDNLDPIQVASSLFYLFLMTVTWLAASLFGFWRNWQRNLMMTAWYCLTLFPLFAGALKPFYFYPVMPAMAYFALQLVYRDTDGKAKVDALFWFGFISMAVVCLAVGFIVHAMFYGAYIEEKNAGEFLAGKENVLIIGDYTPGTFSYKMLEEKRATGEWLDYGMILLPNTSGDLYWPFIHDYSTEYDGVVDKTFANAFAVHVIYRKETNITAFDYICVVGNRTINPGGELVFSRLGNYSSIQVFDMRP
jgi:hypothetical protein